MAYPPHFRVTFGGALYGDEVWQCGFTFGLPIEQNEDGTWTGGSNVQSMVTQANSTILTVGQAIGTYWGSNNSGLRISATLKWVKTAVLVQDPASPVGRVYAPQMGQVPMYEPAVPISPSSTQPAGSSSLVPGQVGLAVSWRTSRRRSVGVQGRTYLPSVLLPFDGGSETITSAAATTVTNNFKGMLGNVRTALNNGVAFTTQEIYDHHVVATPGSPKNGWRGGAFRVVEYRTGRRHDIQRRRANAAPELYITVAA